MTRLSVCGLGVSCNEMSDTPMLLVVGAVCVGTSEIRKNGEKLCDRNALSFSTL